jgi:hypothetical protein
VSGLDAQPQITATFELRRAESSCCGAGLGVIPGDDSPRWSCRACGNECARVLGEPQEVTAHG